MSNSNWNDRISQEVQAIKADAQPDEAAACRAGELAGLLNTIVAQISDADRRHSDTLQQMQERLSGMGRDARTLRNRVPDQFQSVFERIEAGMSELASRIAEISGTVSDAPAFAAAAPDVAVSAAHSAAHSAPAPTADTQPAVLRSAREHHGQGEHAPTALGQPARPRGDDSQRTYGGVDPFDVIETSLPGNTAHPWDDEAADALARMYDREGPSLGGDAPAAVAPSAMMAMSAAPASSTPAAHETGRAPSGIDQTWIEAKFADISERITQSLADINPDQSFFALSQRLEQFERQFNASMDTVAVRADVEGLHLIEAHMSELVGHLEATHQQLQRLDGIEEQLADIAGKFGSVDFNAFAGGAAVASAEPAPALDVDALARAVARETAALIPATPAVAHIPGLDDMQGLMHRLMSDVRQGEENTTALLDTLQQAMIRLLDRVDAIELNQHQAASAAQAAPQEYVREQVRFNVEPQRGMDQGRMQHYGTNDGRDVLDAAIAAVATAKTMGSPFTHAPSDDRADHDDMDVEMHHDVPPAQVRTEPAAPAAPSVAHIAPAQMRPSDQIRQDFIADARRAKMRLAAEKLDGDDVLIVNPQDRPQDRVPDRAARDLPAAAAPGAASAKPGKAGAAKAIPGKSGGVATPRVMALAIALLIAGGAWLVIPRGARPPATTIEAADADAPAAAKGAKATAETSQKGSSAADAKAGAKAATNTENDGDNAPSTDQLNSFEATTTGAIVQGDIVVGGTSVPLSGITVDTDEHVTAADLQRARRQHAMASVSSKLGQAAAADQLPATQTALVPDAIDPQAFAHSTNQTDVAKMTVPASGALDLPPASVGPLSLRLAAANGDSSAEFEVGARLAEGKGTNQNFKEAAKWYQRAADKDFVQAQYRLGTLYERGLGVKADVARATDWYQRAAERGNIKAMHNLAVLSAGQNKAAPDYATAAKWFNEAADRGLSDSQFNLAVLYENGLGVEQSMAQAYKWLTLAAKGGDKEAVRRRDILRGKLTADEISAAEQMTAVFKSKPNDVMANDARTAGEAWKKNSANGVSG
ncbi:MAG: tetratricopeptide repeat protein [Hyphomicrobium sp.]